MVAHELYHFLADKTRHAAAGLAAASHDWLELVSGTAAFRETDLPRLIARSAGSDLVTDPYRIMDRDKH